MRWTRYEDYLRSPVWAAKRRAVMVRCEKYCERCDFGTATQVHHLNYDHAWGEEPLSVLRGYCRFCHQYVHGKSRLDPIKVGYVGMLSYEFEELVKCS